MTETFIIEATSNTPYICIDSNTGLMEIKGVSIPEDPMEFYKPVWEWLSTVFNETAPKKIEVKIQMAYFNSSSLKCIIDIFRKLVEIKNAGKDIQVLINWYYSKDDEDMLETGTDCEKIIGIPFKIIAME